MQNFRLYTCVWRDKKSTTDLKVCKNFMEIYSNIKTIED